MNKFLTHSCGGQALIHMEYTFAANITKKETAHKFTKLTYRKQLHYLQRKEVSNYRFVFIEQIPVCRNPITLFGMY